jgi:hypothetical protein
MRLFLTIVSFVFINVFVIGCTSMSNHNDLQISVDNKDGDAETLPHSPKESPRPEIRKEPQKANPPHLWKWTDTAKKR